MKKQNESALAKIFFLSFMLLSSTSFLIANTSADDDTDSTDVRNTPRGMANGIPSGVKVKNMDSKSFADEPAGGHSSSGNGSITEEQKKQLKESMDMIKKNSEDQKKALDELMEEGE